MANQFNYSILAQIIMHIQDNLKMNVGTIEHIGDNKFSICVDDIGFLSGCSYTAQFHIEDGKVIQSNMSNYTLH